MHKEWIQCSWMMSCTKCIFHRFGLLCPVISQCPESVRSSILRISEPFHEYTKEINHNETRWSLAKKIAVSKIQNAPMISRINS